MSQVSLHSVFAPGKPEELTIATIRAGIVCHENIGHIISLYQCALYLHATFDPKTFSIEEVQRCYDIYRLAIAKATDHEYMNATRLDVYWNNPYPAGHLYGTVCRSRSDIAKSMLKMPMIRFPCYNVDYQGRPGWPEDTKKFPAFTLEELLKDDHKYEIFKAFWRSAPGFQETFDAINDSFPARPPRDIVYLIIHLACKL